MSGSPPTQEDDGLPGDDSIPNEAEIWADILREEERIDRLDYRRAIVRLIFGPGIARSGAAPWWRRLQWRVFGPAWRRRDLARDRKLSVPEFWTLRHRAELLLTMIFGRRDEGRESWRSHEVLCLWVESSGYGWSSRTVIYWPGEWRWNFDSDGDSYM